MAECCMPLLQPQPTPPTPEAAAEAHDVATSIGEANYGYRILHTRDAVVQNMSKIQKPWRRVS